jgi:septum formation protein
MAANPGLILASRSPRRLELLREAGFEFSVEPADVDESDYPVITLPAEIAQYLAAAKARAVAQRFPNSVVLGADTVVAFGDAAIGKPADAEDARRMIRLLSGTTHIVVTGVSLVCASRNNARELHVMSAVRMRSLTDAEIDRYVASVEWLGKAGGYGIQDADPFVDRMSGCHTNIVGLPVPTVTRLLAEAGIYPSSSVANSESHS